MQKTPDVFPPGVNLITLKLLEVSVQQSTNVLFQRFRIIEKSRAIKPIIKDYSFKLILSFCAFSYYV